MRIDRYGKRLSSLLAVALLMSACASGTSEPDAAKLDGGDDPQNAAAPIAAAADEIVVLQATLGNENFLVPWTDTPSAQAVRPVFETLLDNDPDTGEIVQHEGHLAESWEVSEDHLTYTFHLREGVEFHDGWGEFTAEDVLFSYELVTRDDSKDPSAGNLRDNIDRLEAPDPYTVVMHMKQPYPNVLNMFGIRSTTLGIFSKAYYDEVGEDAASRHPIGTGPYRFVDHTLGESVSFEAVEDHWRQTAAVENLTVRAVPEASARTAMLQNGEAHLASISYDAVADAEGAGLAIHAVEDQNLTSIHLQGQYVDPQYAESETPPWAVADEEEALLVRRALSHAIDRDEIVEFVMGGYGAVEGACAVGFFPENLGHDPSCEPDAYDPDLATQLLQEAGYDDPSELSFVVDLTGHPARPFGSDVLEAAAQQWRNLGIDVTMQKTDWAANLELAGARTATTAIAYAAPHFDDAASLLAVFSFTDGTATFNRESNELDDLISGALATTEPEGMEAARVELFDYVIETLPSIPVAYGDLLYASASNLTWPMNAAAYSVHNFELMELE